ncbi:poly-gamma-glutamate synthesis protein (capsule biosynthesis protein) [Clostridium sp. DSM 8431]|uniref:CapA family protein n=1 Tax=Clostridium sp. DSM 8431 TaxID=1761781 RepID=UPI0008F44652|nr:CapA family protein [Clostridium sp. DSM 8431]SFU28207.1 poly-gamma-glutamate synthesis protein (capsule biosynthesis protein) [Clostridium sp. DSM 8431]
MKSKKCNFKFFIILSFTILFLNQCTVSKDTNNNFNEEPMKKEEENKENCSIVFAGDILLHNAELEAEYNKESNVYNFDEFFINVKDYIQSADIAVCNSETTFLGKNSGYSGYPDFNSPPEILTSLKTCGFDIVSSAHNHILDRGYDGFINTVKNIKNSGLDLIGIQENENDKNYVIKDINDIKVGFTNYSYCGEKQSKHTFNNIELPSSLENKINLFSDESNIDKYLEGINKTIENMKKDGAQYIIFYIHWGIEYQTTANDKQKYLAKKLSELGVDAIIGSHPHVVQPIETIKNEASNKETLVCYSLGNFISNQREETMGNRKSEDGLMIKLNLEKTNNKVSLKSYESEPTWVNKYNDNLGNPHYNIMKDKDVLDNADDYSTEVFNDAKESFDSTLEIINTK